MDKKLAVFDWNGTLFDDADANLNAANKCLVAFGQSTISMEHYRDTFDFPIIHFYERNGVNADEFLKNVDMSCDLFVDAYEAEAEKSSLRSGAIELFEYLRENDFIIMILSNHLTHLVQKQLDRFDIRRYFDHVSGNIDKESVISKMNKEHRMNKFLNENDIKPENAFIIGDSFEEPHIAQHIGMKSINITGGCISRERLVKAKANIIVDNLDELPNIIENFWK